MYICFLVNMIRYNAVHVQLFGHQLQLISYINMNCLGYQICIDTNYINK
jgi:hypothetical protein